MEKVASVSTSEYFRLESGIIYSRIYKSQKITVADVKESAEALREVKGDGDKLLLISDISDMKGMERDARKYSEQEAGYDDLLKANAIIVKNSIAKVVGNFLMGFNKGNFPMKLFTNEQDATKWLEQFLVQEEEAKTEEDTIKEKNLK